MRQRLNEDRDSISDSSFSGSGTVGTDHGYALRRYLLETETVLGESPPFGPETPEPESPLPDQGDDQSPDDWTTVHVAAQNGHHRIGQTVDDALIIEVPKRPSPMVGHPMPYYIAEELRPEEGTGEYFPPMPAMASPRLNHVTHASNPHLLSHAMAILTTGPLPPLPSPGDRTHRHHGRPYGRQHTSSPTILHSIPPGGNLAGASAGLYCVR
jgi:hypothetical protein